MPRLAMNGKGWAGSIASGVRIGRMSDMNRPASVSRSVMVSSDGSTTAMPAARSSTRSARQQSCWSCISAPMHTRIAASCSAGVSPSSETVLMPARCWAIRPATRTMLNSSMLAAEIARKRSRSSSG